jgi:hypothetical protein
MAKVQKPASVGKGVSPILRQPDVTGYGDISAHSTDTGATLTMRVDTGDVVEADIGPDRALGIAATLLLSAMTVRARQGVDPEVTINDFLRVVDRQASEASRRGRA